MTATRLLVLFLLAASPSFGQVRFGIKAGVPITDNLLIHNVEPVGKSGFALYAADTKRYTVGPTIEVGLPLNLALGFDALYRRINYEQRGFVPGLHTLRATTGNSWQFPVLLKYNIAGNVTEPFLDMGVSFHHVSASTRHSLLGDPFGTGMPGFVGPPLSAPELIRDFNIGFVVGAGWDIRLPVIRLSPEFRYTRWSSENFSGQVLRTTVLRSNRNQVDFLLGLTF